jgi:hypothetical protein
MTTEGTPSDPGPNAQPAGRRPYRWPESEFYVSERHRLVYCPIQKVACTSLKLWWAELVDGSSAPFVSLNEYGQPSIDHAALNQRYKLHYQSPALGRRPLEDDDWFRFVFVRDPWSRLVSAFVNKFVPLHDLAQPIFDQTHARWGQERPSAGDVLRNFWGRSPRDERLRRSLWLWIRGPNAWKNEFTFRHFVELLADANLADDETDPTGARSTGFWETSLSTSWAASNGWKRICGWSPIAWASGFRCRRPTARYTTLGGSPANHSPIGP